MTLALARRIPRNRPVLPSVRGRCIAFACGVALLPALAVGSVSYLLMFETKLDEEKAKLDAQSRLIVPHIAAEFERMKTSALALSRTLAFRGLARAMANGGRDPLDGTTEAEWRARLGVIFGSILAREQDYVALRYIGVGERGRELVGVDRRGGAIAPVPDDRLRWKPDQPYLQAVLGLDPGRVHVSTVSLKSGQGAADGHLPVIRAVAPVHSDDGRVLGMMVINADFGRVMKRVLQKIGPDRDGYVLTAAGDYLARYRRREIPPLRFRSANATAPPPAIGALARASGPGAGIVRIGGGRYLMHATEFPADPGDPESRIKIALVAPMGDLIAQARGVLRWEMAVGVGLIACAGLISVVSARRFSKPIERIIGETRAYAKGKEQLDLPVDRPDEIGELSRAFNDLVRSLKEARDTERAALERIATMRLYDADALVGTDEDGVIKDFNIAAEKLFGYRAAEIVGDSIGRLLPGAGLLEIFARCKDAGQSGGWVASEGLRKGGSRFIAGLRVTPILVGRGHFFSVTVRDADERDHLDPRIARYVAELERCNQELEDFAYIASHDLREPLRGIANHVQFLKEDCGDSLGEAGLRRITRLQQLCRHADSLTSDLLQWSRLGSGDFAEDPVDVGAVIDSIRDGLAETMKERNAVIVRAGDLPDVIGDQPRIASLFTNLIVNAVKYNDSPEKVVEVGCLPALCGPQGREKDVYYVKDNGIGIPKAYHEAVFSLFKRLHSPKLYGPGTGAGLSFAAKIVERHGGRIWLESAENQGTTFYFTLRRAKNDTA